MHKPLEQRRSIGLFGGTFDPIHFGHLRAALEIYENLKLNEMRIIPCKQPPHRAVPKAAPFARVEMVRNAVINTPLILDDREMHRDGPSYTVDTLMSFRREFPKASLSLLVGVDTFLGLTSWYQWEKIIQLANIIVMHRHGWTVPETGIIAELLQTYALENGEHITDFSSGRIITQSITPLDISATKIRTLLKSGQSPQFLCPDPVLKYIEAHRLYEYTASPNGHGNANANGYPINNQNIANGYNTNNYNNHVSGYSNGHNHYSNGYSNYSNGNGYTNGLPADLSAVALANAETLAKAGNGLPTDLSAVALVKAEALAQAGNGLSTNMKSEYTNGSSAPSTPHTINSPPEVTHI